jgi:two-component system, LytTR family, sensor kinase
VSDKQKAPGLTVLEGELSKGVEIRYPGLGMMFLIWTGIGALTSIRYSLMSPSKPDTEWLSELLACTACYYPWIILTPIAFRIEKRFSLGPGKWARNLALLAMISVPFCLLASPLMLASFMTVSSALRGSTWAPPSGVFWLREVLLAEIIFWCSVAGGYFIRVLFQLREHERSVARLALEKSQLEAGLNQAQLEVLRARLNPHFLFNSLQNISVLTRQDPRTASRMLTRLGDLLHMVLSQDSLPESTLQDEIELTQAYVALEQMRFGDRLYVSFEISQDMQQAMVPCFLLQPLIENAIIHGLQGARKTGVITVSAISQKDALVLTVTDNGIGLPAENPDKIKIGIGLRSTRERLARMYPNRHTFSMRKPEAGGAEVRIAIPLRFADYEDTPSHEEQPAIAYR